MNKRQKTLKPKVGVFLVVSIMVFAGIIAAEEVINEAPKINGSVTNNGLVEEGQEITFTSTCQGMNTTLVICRENSICNANTQVPDLLCASAVSEEQGKQCRYKTTARDNTLHDNDIATCCDEAGSCDTNVVKIESWSMTAASTPFEVRVTDENKNALEATINTQGTTVEIKIANAPINQLFLTNLTGTTIGVSNTSRGIVEPENVSFTKIFALNLEEITFGEATMTAIATGSLLYHCKFWDFEAGICLGSWELLASITEDQEYTINLTKGSVGFAEGKSHQQKSVTEPTNESLPKEPREKVPEEVNILATTTNNGPVEEGSNITFFGTCSGSITKLIICKENSICNTQTKKEDLLCESAETDNAEKTCAYKTEVKDLGEHTNDIATCCNANNACASTTALIEPWTVKEKVIAEINRTLPEEKNVTPAEEVNLTQPENISLPPPAQQPIAAPEIPREKPWIIWSYTQEEAASLKNNGRLFNELFKHIRIEDKDEAKPANASIKIEAVVVIDNTTEGVIVSKYDYLHGKHYEVKIGSEGDILFDVGDPDMSVTLETTKSYRDGQTHVIVASLDKGLALLVVDGKEEARVNAVIQDMESDVAVSIGANIGFVPWMGITLNEFKGVIKDVKVTYK